MKPTVTVAHNEYARNVLALAQQLKRFGVAFAHRGMVALHERAIRIVCMQIALGIVRRGVIVCDQVAERIVYRAYLFRVRRAAYCKIGYCLRKCRRRRCRIIRERNFERHL
ncbi:hypothetical protein SDC9_197129 [bioreactor metagenome]|uniref:Uncharacterized protein n=1 Tax=bioreactor metagenome TaxID=1076179 RepID=A0A645IDW7_9ZZZZ